MIFNRLSKEALKEIVNLRMQEVQQRLENRRIQLDIQPDAKQWLAETGFDPVYGMLTNAFRSIIVLNKY